MGDATFKRMKHGHVPGDIGKHQKAKYRAKPSASKQAKSFSNMIRSKTRAVLLEKTKKEIREVE